MKNPPPEVKEVVTPDSSMISDNTAPARLEGEVAKTGVPEAFHFTGLRRANLRAGTNLAALRMLVRSGELVNGRLWLRAVLPHRLKAATTQGDLIQRSRQGASHAPRLWPRRRLPPALRRRTKRQGPNAEREDYFSACCRILGGRFSTAEMRVPVTRVLPPAERQCESAILPRRPARTLRLSSPAAQGCSNNLASNFSTARKSVTWGKR
jgi:hypothetical protein